MRRWQPDRARTVAELSAGELLAVYCLAVQVGAIDEPAGVDANVWTWYARIALWEPTRPRPHVIKGAM